MPRRLLFAGMLLASASAQAADCVVLLHGLMRSASSMKPMESALIADGFETVNVDYPSRDFTIEELAPMAVEQGLVECRAAGPVRRIHFVTHSMGGILLRQYLAGHDIPDLGRAVMLAPPNQGSIAADKFGRLPGFDWLNGPAGRQLGKGEDSVPRGLGPANFEVGVIAGSRTIDPVTSAVLPNPDDGRVSVEDTKLEGMADFIVVEHSHALMMRARDTIDFTLRFLREGRFDDSDAPR